MSKKMKTTLIILLLVASLALSFGAGCVLGTKTAAAPSQGLEIIGQAWNIIFEDYVDKSKLDAGALSQAAIEGMLKSIDDPYTSYLDAGNFQLGLSSLEGEFEGIGAYVGVEDGKITIIAPIADSPAAKAGIRAGDIILEVNVKPASEMSLAQVVLTIRGPKGTPVRLLILHQGETKPVEIEIIRAEIRVPSVRFEMKEDIAYISITHFSERTDQELAPILQDLTREGATGIILDLRSNPGGLLQTVIDVASHFLNEGVIVNVLDNQGIRTVIAAKPKEITTSLPLVVLTDNYSASGSEVLAGALKDHARAIVAGTKTYGKGSVNILRQLRDGSGLYITTARWLTPNGHLIEGKGIYPDYELELKGDEAVQWAMDYLKKPSR